RAREPRDGGLPAPGPGRGGGDAGVGHGAVPAPGRARRPAGRHPVRRRAADAGHRPGPDVAAPAADPGRAVAGPGPADGEGDLRRRGPHRPGGDHGAAGRAEPGAVAQALPPGLRPRDGPHRAQRHRRGAAGQSPHPPGVPGTLVTAEEEAPMSRITRRELLKSSAAAAVGGGLAPRVAAAQGKEVLVAAVVALTGPNAAWGQRTWNAFQLGCELVNAGGGVKALGGARFKAVVADTESKPEVAGSQTEKVIQQGAVAITGTNQSAATIVATQIAERETVPFVCATDVDPLICSRG